MKNKFKISFLVFAIFLGQSCGLRNDGEKTDLNLEEITDASQEFDPSRAPGSNSKQTTPPNNTPTPGGGSNPGSGSNPPNGNNNPPPPPPAPTPTLLQSANVIKGDRKFIRQIFLRIFGNGISNILQDNINARVNTHGRHTDIYLANTNNSNQFEFPERSIIDNADRANYIPKVHIPESVIQEGLIINTCMRILDTKQNEVNNLFASLSINTNQALDRSKLNLLYKKFYPSEDLTDFHWNTFLALEAEYNNSRKTWEQSLFYICISPQWKLI